MEILIFGILVFIFIFSWLIVIENIYKFIKVMRLKEGKIDSSLFSKITLGSAISYIITMLIIGF